MRRGDTVNMYTTSHPHCYLDNLQGRECLLLEVLFCILLFGHEYREDSYRPLQNCVSENGSQRIGQSGYCW